MPRSVATDGPEEGVAADVPAVTRDGVSRAEFEGLLRLRLDKVQAGTFLKAKRQTGGAWQIIVDNLYERNAERLAANEFAAVSAECADAILRLLRNLAPE